MKKQVLITGMSGLIGTALKNYLSDKHHLSALNRSHVAGVQCYQADITDLNSILPAFENKDTVVHLSAIWRDDPSWNDFLNCNVIGTYNVFEAARLANVKRIIFASSGATIAGWEKSSPYSDLANGKYDKLSSWENLTKDSPIRPKGIYGCTKVWGESLAKHYSDEYGISVICLRIGAVTQADKPVQLRHYPIWCSQKDVSQMVDKCIDAPSDLLFDTFYVTSNNKWGYRDLEHAAKTVGYVPEDSSDNFELEADEKTKTGFYNFS